MNTLNIAVAGAQGRVGKLLLAIINDDVSLSLAASLTRSDTELPASDVMVDFSSPAGFRQWLAACRKASVPFVSGTTGLTPSDYSLLDDAARDIAVLHATNTSLGVAVLNHLAATAARMLGDEFDVEIVEAHHRQKKDAPSGTAETLAERVVEALDRSRDDLQYGRHGMEPRRPASVGVHAMRLGDVVGEHTVHYAGAGERLFIGHAATSRETFARGAIRAARWIAGKPAGRYAMTDVLGLTGTAR